MNSFVCACFACEQTRNRDYERTARVWAFGARRSIFGKAEMLCVLSALCHVFGKRCVPGFALFSKLSKIDVDLETNWVITYKLYYIQGVSAKKLTGFSFYHKWNTHTKSHTRH